MILFFLFLQDLSYKQFHREEEEDILWKAEMVRQMARCRYGEVRPENE